MKRYQVKTFHINNPTLPPKQIVTDKQLVSDFSFTYNIDGGNGVTNLSIKDVDTTRFTIGDIVEVSMFSDDLDFSLFKNIYGQSIITTEDDIPIAIEQGDFNYISTTTGIVVYKGIINEVSYEQLDSRSITNLECYGLFSLLNNTSSQSYANFESSNSVMKRCLDDFQLEYGSDIIKYTPFSFNINLNVVENGTSAVITNATWVLFNGSWTFNEFQRVANGDTQGLTIKRVVGSSDGLLEQTTDYDVVTQSGILGTTIKSTGNVTTTNQDIVITYDYIPKDKSSLDVIKSAKLGGYFIVDSDGLFLSGIKPESPTHTLYKSKDVQSIIVREDRDSIVNRVVAVGTYTEVTQVGDTTVEADIPISATVQDQFSIDSYGLSDIFVDLGSVGSGGPGTAYTIGQQSIDALASFRLSPDPEIRTTVKVNSKYPYEFMKPGQTITVRNTPIPIDNLQIKVIRYDRNFAELELENYSTISLSLATI